MNGYKTINEMAELWGLSPRRVRAMCQDGKINGVEKLGRGWIIPVAAKRPVDGRVTTGEYKNWRKNQTSED